MNDLLKSAIAAAGALAAAPGIASADDSADRAAIVRALSAYEAALNASDVKTVLTLYADDGVFMPQHSLPSVGTGAIRTAYEGVFAAIKLDVAFQIDEMMQVAPDWAFVRTRSEGFVTFNAAGNRAPEANQELFIFKKADGENWKIARYIFSTTNPPRQ